VRVKSLLFVLLLSVPVGAASAPESVVREFYGHIIKDHPLGLPEGATKAALWPLMTPRLVRVLDAARACEADYFRKHPANGDEKPEFWWLEAGLFSGENEMALPAQFEIMNDEALPKNQHRLTLRFTYLESVDENGRAPDPASAFQWRGAVIVACDDERCRIDDFIPFDIDTAKPLTPLSQSFTSCKAGKWMGE
jgi:hypothetical protein